MPRPLLLLLAACAAASFTLGPTVTVYDGPASDLEAVAKLLLSQLDAAAGVFHANTTLWATQHSSFHVFATNLTEPCHYHPRDTVSTTIQGRGAFRVPYSSPVPQRQLDQFVIAAGQVHSFGPVEGRDAQPVAVSVMWSPPAGHFDNRGWQWAPDVTIPASGCRAE